MTAKNIVLWLGIILVIVGIIGFFNNPVLGIFQVNGLHNVVHILTGILGVIFGLMSEAAAKNYAKTFGVIYALVFILGLFTSGGMILGILATNAADNVLHLLLALVFLWVGFYPIGQKQMM